MNDEHIEEAKQIATKMLDMAQCNISGHKVGACVIAENNEGNTALFGGCNQEWSTSVVHHAERVAMINAITEGFIHPKMCIVTSGNKLQAVPMCGYCRQDYMYMNQQCEVMVFDPKNMEEKLRVTLIDTLKYPYLNKGKLR